MNSPIFSSIIYSLLTFCICALIFIFGTLNRIISNHIKIWSSSIFIIFIIISSLFFITNFTIKPKINEYKIINIVNNTGGAGGYSGATSDEFCINYIKNKQLRSICVDSDDITIINKHKSKIRIIKYTFGGYEKVFINKNEYKKLLK